VKILTLYDGTLHAKSALQYGIKSVREKGGELVVLHVFQSSLFVDYDAGPGALELASAESRQHRRDAENIIQKEGTDVKVRILTEEGDPEREILDVAATEHADLILAPPRYKSIVKKAPCPVYLIPGLILVPMDDTDVQFENKEKIVEEALSTGSRVLLLGIVPIHIYSREEKEELEKVRKDTGLRLNRMGKMLGERGIENEKIIRSGYPDEEIMRASIEFTASLIILPSGGSIPSELRKAALVILDEKDRMKSPLLLISALQMG
jgi:nucleotide-binding universal stress UspA family protein